MPDALDDWMNAGHHLPNFMRDFHDQKDLFKMLHDTYRQKCKDSIDGEYPPSFTVGDTPRYTVDVFLWTMAQHGYTLQRTRKRLAFSDITTTIREAISKQQDHAVALWRSVFKSRK